MQTEIIDIARAYGEALVEIGKKFPEVVSVDADLAESCYSHLFREHFPERTVEVGVAEATAMMVGAGLALSGKIPFVNTFAVFATSRVFDQVRQVIAYGKVNVKIIGSGGGLSLGYAGASHHAIEDLALVRALPNMTVVVPADSIETRLMLHAITELDGPVYMRLSRAKIPPIYTEDYIFSLNKAVVLRPGNDVTLFATGDMVSKALDAANHLAEKDISAEVINVHTLKPLDYKTIARSAGKTGAAITIEDHNIIGGLGGAIAECLAEHCPTPMRRIGLQDTFCESDDTEVLRKAYGLTVDQIVTAAVNVIQSKK